MKNLFHSKIIKSISVFLSILLIWQGVSYANPDIFQRNTLQNPTLFTGLRDDDSFLAASAGYFSGYLEQLENEPQNQNVFRMKSRVEALIEELSGSEKLPEEYKNEIPEVMQAFTGEGEFMLNAGAFKIRYYNPNIHENASDPGVSFQVVADKEIGRYLSRQILIQKALAIPKEQDEKEEPREVEEKIIPQEVATEVKGKRVEYSSLGEQLSVAYWPFLHAPVLEEIFKVGLPFGILTVLGVIIPGMPLLNKGIFMVSLALLGFLFTKAHISFKRGPPAVKKILRKISPEYLEEKADEHKITGNDFIKVHLSYIMRVLNMSITEISEIDEIRVEDVDLKKIPLSHTGAIRPWRILNYFAQGKKAFNRKLKKNPPVIFKLGDRYFTTGEEYWNVTAWLMVTCPHMLYQCLC